MLGVVRYAVLLVCMLLVRMRQSPGYALLLKSVSDPFVIWKEVYICYMLIRCIAVRIRCSVWEMDVCVTMSHKCEAQHVGCAARYQLPLLSCLAA